MRLRIRLATMVAACVLSRSALGQTPTGPNPVGVWRGTSLCLVRPSSCNDEVVVYRIARVGTADSLSLDGRRIVNGQEVEMGALGCRLNPPKGQITCTIPNGTWRFTVRGDSLTGDLTLPDNRKSRDVRTARSR